MTKPSLTIATVLLFCGVSSFADEPVANDGRPQFDDDQAMLVPTDYREWIFVGSSLGIGYEEKEKPDMSTFRHIYINPLGYKQFKETGEFPVGTVLMLESVAKGEKANPALTGIYADKFVGLEAAVKTGDRFEDLWTYYSFSTKEGTPKPSAQHLKTKSCIKCHLEHAEIDHVFTQFYPVLRAAR